MNSLLNVRHTLAVASGKGGVGKSTTAVNLALALRKQGLSVGILDADIYGPSQPLMLGLQGRQIGVGEDGFMEPFSAHDLLVNSMGFLVETQQAVVWRGPMVSSAVQQLLHQTRWGKLDVLIIDLPPGTGDIHLTFAKKYR